MKKMITILGLVCMSCTVFAAENASKSERAFLCSAVGQMLEFTSADRGLDPKECVLERNITSKSVTAENRQVEGVLTFRSPGRDGFKLTCAASYRGKPSLENLIGDIESIVCQ